MDRYEDEWQGKEALLLSHVLLSCRCSVPPVSWEPTKHSSSSWTPIIHNQEEPPCLPRV